MRQSLYDYCMEHNRIDLLMQWDTDANLPLTPKTVTSGSSRAISWFCDKGHTWHQAPYERTSAHHSCPVCAGKKIIPGVNDLKTLSPDVAAEWHPTKNGVLRPETLSPYTHRKVWWKCGTCGYEWLAQVKSRAGMAKCGCPACAGRVVASGVNDLTTAHPELAKEWHPTKNGTLTPKDVTAGTTRKVWWRCDAGHEWCAAIASRTHGTGCPVCAGRAVLPGINDLASQFPEIAAEWHPTKNGSLAPDAVTAQSNRDAWWVCSKGHEYKAAIASRIARDTGCPYCANRKVLPGFNDLATALPTVAKEWHPALNGSLTPEQVTCGSTKRVWWKCGACGYEWKAVVYSRAAAQRCGCPMCAGKIKQRNQARYQRIMDEASEESFAMKSTDTDL